MARIVLQGMRFHGRHGVHAEEARFGAPFVVDLELEGEFGGSDDLRDTVDYGRVFALAQRIVTGERFALIEALATRLGRAVLASEPLVAALVVRVHKPHAPLPGPFTDVMVELRFERDGVNGATEAARDGR
jgi:7,8-dihydroneopterin aldolase/epimerase/oxygenase